MKSEYQLKSWFKRWYLWLKYMPLAHIKIIYWKIKGKNYHTMMMAIAQAKMGHGYTIDEILEDLDNDLYW